MAAVIPSATIASVIEFEGSDNDPEIFRFVLVTEFATTSAKLVLVVKVIAPPANCINGVPVSLFVPE